MYKFFNLPYEYEPGVTRSVYQERFQSIDKKLREPRVPPLLSQIFTGSPSVTPATSPTSTPLRKRWFWPVVPRPTPQVCLCPDPVPRVSSLCCSSRIFFPVPPPTGPRDFRPTQSVICDEPNLLQTKLDPLAELKRDVRHFT